MAREDRAIKYRGQIFNSGFQTSNGDPIPLLAASLAHALGPHSQLTALPYTSLRKQKRNTNPSFTTPSPQSHFAVLSS